MCFTGGFALATAVDDAVLAPVMSQPAVPFPLGAKRRRDPGVSEAELDRVVQRTTDDGLRRWVPWPDRAGLRLSGRRVV
jgi:hypothetical protein